MIDEHAQGEKVELELDAFITKRDAQRRRSEGERLAEEVWMESERLYNARRRRELDAERYGYLMDSADGIERTAAAIAAGKRAQAARLMEETEQRRTA